VVVHRLRFELREVLLGGYAKLPTVRAALRPQQVQVALLAVPLALGSPLGAPCEPASRKTKNRAEASPHLKLNGPPALALALQIGVGSVEGVTAPLPRRRMHVWRRSGDAKSSGYPNSAMASCQPLLFSLATTSGKLSSRSVACRGSPAC